MIKINNITKSFGTFYALRGIDLQINAGEFWVIVGPNGAGKTTLLKIIATLANPSGGSIDIGDTSSLKNKLNIRKEIGFIGHQSFLYSNLSAAENLKFYGRMYRLKNLQDLIFEKLDQVGLMDRKNDLVRDFSRGMQQRLTIARALLTSPKVILLDEPFSGLDQQGIDLFSNLLKSLVSPQRVILMTTHNLQLGWELASHFAVLSNGKIVKTDSCKNMEFIKFKEHYKKLTGEN